MKNYFIEHRRGLFGTVVFHIIFAVIFIIFGFTTPLPLPEEEGILINFGTDDEGFGLIEPSAAYQPEQEEVSVPEETLIPETEPATAEEEILTQELEEAPEVQTAPVKDPEQEKKEREAREAEERRLAELEQQRLEELERQQQEDLERQRREEEQRRANEIQNRIGDAITGANQAQNTSTGEGVTDSIGNQGRQDGSVESTNRTGDGLGDKGISFSLEGRTPQSLPKPEYNLQAEGIVVVAVTVDRNGNVTSANPGERGSTTLNEYLMTAAKKAALAAKFDRKPEAPATQKGTITYHFILQ